MYCMEVMATSVQEVFKEVIIFWSNANFIDFDDRNKNLYRHYLVAYRGTCIIYSRVVSSIKDKAVVSSIYCIVVSLCSFRLRQVFIVLSVLASLIC